MTSEITTGIRVYPPRYVQHGAPDEHGRITVTTTHFTMKLAGDSDTRRPAVFVADEVSDACSALLRELLTKEANLGTMRGAHRGTDVQVDELYDQINVEIMRVKMVIARQALAVVGQLVTVGLVRGDLAAAIADARFDRFAGCNFCPCSPGVVPGAALYYRDAPLWIWVSALPCN